MVIYPSARISDRCVIRIADDCLIGDYVLITVPELRMGPESQVNAGCKIVGTAPCYIGRGAVVSYNVVVLTASDTLAPKMNDASRLEDRRVTAEPVRIGDYCYIGAQSVIMPGVRMEDYSVVGALSYVPPMTVVKKGSVGWGAPFKAVKSRPLPE